METVRKVLAMVWAALMAGGCASAGGQRVTTAPEPMDVRERAMLVEYVQKLPPGTLVRVQRVSGRSLRGTLMNATDAAVIVQQQTRIPEPPLEIPFSDIAAVTPETGSGFSLAKAIGAGAAAGAGAALAVFVVLAALYD